MADRIERYLGRLEAELEGRVTRDRLEGLLVEVEGHLRESEEAYRELGEPEELANRLAVEGFGGVDELQVQVENKGRLEPFWVRGWQGAATVLAGVSLIGLVLLASIVSSFTAIVWFGVVPLVGLLFAAMFLGRSVWKQAMWGALGGTAILAAVFLSIVRVAFQDEHPVLGLQIGSNDVISRGQAYSPYAMQREAAQAAEMLEEAQVYHEMTKAGVIQLLPYSRESSGGDVMDIYANGRNYGWTRTRDYAAATVSWKKYGDNFMPWMEEMHAGAEKRLALANEFSRSDLKGRLVPLGLGLAQAMGGAGVAILSFIAIGLGLGQLVKGLERLRGRISAASAGN